MIRDPQGRQNIVEAMMEDRGDNVYRCTYRPAQAGTHTVTVTFAGVGIPKSPFNVDVGPGELLELRSITQLLPNTHSVMHVITSTCVSPLFVQPVCRGPAGQQVEVCSRQG